MTTETLAVADRVTEKVKSEAVAANHAATVARFYLLLVLFLIMWALFDTWVNVHSIPGYYGTPPTDWPIRFTTSSSTLF